MKKNLLFLTFLWLSFVALSQAPQGINYQTVVRDGDGQPLANTAISLRMTICDAPSGGTVLYRETHTKTTNAYGLVSLFIGQGTPVIGSFSDVVWGKSACYLETAVDLTGSGQYEVLGVMQFVSVPYSLYSGQAGGILSMTTQERNALVNPPMGMQIYNSTTNCLNYYSGSDWYETCGNLVGNQPPDVPLNPVPSDGAIGLPADLTLSWTCNDPDGDPLAFDLYFGNTNPPDLYESGITSFEFPATLLDFGTTYFWKIVAFDNHGNMTVGPVWSFTTMMCLPPTPWAGNDATICEGDMYQIEAATGGAGIYQVLWGTSGDGTFSNPATENPVYYPGILDVTNGMVELTITGFAAEPCPLLQGSESMILTIQPLPEVWIGEDATICCGDVWQLNPIVTNYDQVQWYTTNGGGFFENEYQPNTIYYPSPSVDCPQGCIEIYLYASPISPCSLGTTDVMNLCFTLLPTADAGPDQLNLPGTTATLAGNTPQTGGYGQWSIESGTGGSIVQPGNPTSTFTGVAGNSYSLKWNVYDQNGCYAEDFVTISFLNTNGQPCPGIPTVTDRDGNVYNTVQLGSQCWMKENLKTTKYRNGTSITNAVSGTAWQNNIDGAYAWYSNNIAYKDTYGALYNWFAVNNNAGLCPTGWHVPTDAQLTALTDYVSSQSAYHCNSTSNYIAKALAAKTNWNSATCSCCVGNNPNANDATNFTALPGGYRSSDGAFSELSYYGNWWSSTEDYSSPFVWYRYMSWHYVGVHKAGSFKSSGFSLRCLKD